MTTAALTTVTYNMRLPRGAVGAPTLMTSVRARAHVLREEAPEIPPLERDGRLLRQPAPASRGTRVLDEHLEHADRIRHRDLEGEVGRRNGVGERDLPDAR